MLDNFTLNFRRALSFVLHNNGQILESDIDDLLEHFKVDKGIEIDKEEFLYEVKEAKQFFKNFDKCLFVCTNVTCSKLSYFESSKESFENLSKSIDCPVIPTGCHWQCENAPVVTMKKGSQLQSFVNCSNSSSWDSVIENAKNNCHEKL